VPFSIASKEGRLREASAHLAHRTREWNYVRRESWATFKAIEQLIDGQMTVDCARPSAGVLPVGRRPRQRSKKPHPRRVVLKAVEGYIGHFRMEVLMVFNVVWWNNARVIGTAVQDSLDEAIALAKAHFPVTMQYMPSTSVEVTDEAGHVHFELESKSALIGNPPPAWSPQAYRAH
jgi:hypothetical protein